MAMINVLDMAGNNAGDMELNDAIFGIEPNPSRRMCLQDT